MMNCTLKEAWTALETLPPYRAKTAEELMWYIKDCYKGYLFVNEQTVQRALKKHFNVFKSGVINGDEKFWKTDCVRATVSAEQIQKWLRKQQLNQTVGM